MRRAIDADESNDSDLPLLDLEIQRIQFDDRFNLQ